MSDPLNLLLDPRQSPTEFYAPRFEILVRNQQLDPSTHGDILSLKVDMDADNLDRFDFTVNNWDDRTLDFKYSDSDTFDVNTPVKVSIGYADRLVTIMHGAIESLTPSFPESGSPTLAVAGTNSLNRLRGRKAGPNEQKKFENMREFEIVQIVAARNGLTPRCDEDQHLNDIIWQRDLDDAMFLMERARRIDFDLYVQTDPSTSEDCLYFVNPKDKRGSGPVRSYVFEWGKSLMSFSPKLNASRQVGKVTVRGWNSATKEPFVATATAASLPQTSSGGKSGPDVAGNKGDEVVDSLVTSQTEAQRIADSILTEKAYDFITGEGRVIGLADLRPGDVVELKGLGTRFSGDYHLRRVSHSVGADGFTTTFGARRLFDGGLKT
jgi:phage protein D